MPADPLTTGPCSFPPSAAACQSVHYAGSPTAGAVAVLRLGPVGDMAARIAQHLCFRVIAVDLVPERGLGCEPRYETVGLADHEKDFGDVVRACTDG